MGTGSSSRADKPESAETDRDTLDDGHATDLLPEEVMILCLSYIPGRDIVLNCRRVCKPWRDLVDTATLWRIKCERDGILLPDLPEHPTPTVEELKRYCIKKPFGTNLLQNPYGKGMASWKVVSNGGDRWLCESNPSGAKPFPDISLESGNFEDPLCCWTTSYGWCMKTQVVDLQKFGVSQKFMDEVKPAIHISEWVAPRWDCGSVYVLEVHLLSASEAVIDKYKTSRQAEQWNSAEWEQVSHTISNYNKGVRYISFNHGGKDSQFWAGHYGYKMTAPCVKLLFKS